MMDWRVLLSLTLLVYPASAANTTRCFECSDLPHPAYCQRVTQCTEAQKCMLEEIVTSGGLVLYNSGCMSPMRCSLDKRYDMSDQGPGPALRIDADTDDDVTSCIECCDGDFCNHQGCGTVAKKPPDRGPLCFQCDYLDAPDKCRTVVQCRIGEVCMLREWSPVVADGRSIYRSSCQTPGGCAGDMSLLVGKRRADGCHACCTDDFCNDKCQPASTAQSLLTIATTATTTHLPSISSKPTTLALISPTFSSTPSKQTTNALQFRELCESHRYTYDEHSNLCYAMHADHVTWNEANNRCKNEGGMLAVIDTPEKWQLLQRAITHHYDHDVFIGGRGHGTHSTDYHWTNGARFEFTAWGREQPDSHHEDCVAVDQHDHQWHDTECNHHLHFVCTME